MDIETLNRTLVDFLRTYVIHPSASKKSKWIYVDYPRPDATFPRISVSQIGHTTSSAGIGERGPSDLGEWQETSFDIDIWVKKGNSFDIDGSVKTGTALRDYLGDQVIQQLMNGKQWLLTNKFIKDLRITGTMTVPYMDSNELFRRTITIRLTYFRTKVPF